MTKIQHGQEKQAMRKKKKKGKYKTAKVICIMLALLLLLFAGGWFYVDSLAYKVCRVEAGVKVEPSDFLKKPDETAFFTGESQPFHIEEPGEYHIEVKSGWFTHKCTLIIEDTIAPTCEPVPVKMEIGQTCGADVFVTNITDATAVTVEYAAEPDFTKAGGQTVQVVLTDKGNNMSVVEAELFLSPVVEDLTVEAGQGAPRPESFLISGKEVSFITEVDAFDYGRVGDYEVSLKVDGAVYTSRLHVADTMPPMAEVQDVEGFALVPRKAEEFIVGIEDATDVTADFLEEPDLSYIGTQEVIISFTDGGGNETQKTAQLTLFEDTEAPVISGAKDLQYFIGDTISYKKNISVTDNCPDGLVLEVDTAGVNLNEEGVYPITYTAKDLAGNATSVTVNLTVTPRMYSIEEVDALADAVLAEIITPEMTELEKVQAIYNWNIRHIAYINHSEKGDWVRAAYEGLADRKGDCYVYACTAKELLTRAGISNMDITKIPTRREHYWNLVDIGEGWYHFDTTPRTDHPRIFMWTDEELMEYSAMHYNSHNYDRSLYPEIN